MNPSTLEKYVKEKETNQKTVFPPREELIFDDGEPMESDDHRDFMNNLINILRNAWKYKSDFFVGGNMAIYFSPGQVKNRDFRAPDFFLVKNVDGSINRDGWVVWEEGFKYPDLVLELLSKTTKEVDIDVKKDIYEQVFKTHEYFVYDPFDTTSLQGWRLVNGKFEPIILENGRLWSEVLEYFIGVWEGPLNNKWREWLRFFKRDGSLVLNIDEQEKENANREKERANREEERANREEERANREEERANREKERANTLAEKLRLMGIDPNGL